MKYELAGEDDKVFKIKHPDGSEFHVAKNAVGPELHKRIKGLKPIKMAEGGEVPDPLDERMSSYLPDQTLVDPTIGIEPDPNIAPNGGGILNNIFNSDYNPVTDANNVALAERAPSAEVLPQQVAPQDASAPILPQAPKPVAQVAPIGPDPLAKAESAIKSSMATQQEEGRKQSSILESLALQQDQVERELVKKIAPIQEELNQNAIAIKNHKVDQNRLWNSMSTGNRIGAAISMLLSGLGSGLTGQKNMAIAAIDKAIDNDVASQKAELGKIENLYSINLKRLESERAAATATKLHNLNIAKSQIEASLARNNNAKSAQEGALAIADLNMKMDRAKKELGAEVLRRQLLGGQIPLDDNTVQMLPEADRQRLVKIGGKYTPALDADSAKKAREIVGATEAMNSNFDELIAMRKKYGAEKMPGPTRTKMLTLAAGLDLSMKESERLGVLDKDAKEYMEKLVGDPTSFSFVEEKLKTTREANARKSREKLKSFGINAENAFAPTQELEERQTKDGRIALFDRNTKNFIRFK